MNEYKDDDSCIEALMKLINIYVPVVSLSTIIICNHRMIIELCRTSLEYTPAEFYEECMLQPTEVFT